MGAVPLAKAAPRPEIFLRRCFSWLKRCFSWGGAVGLTRPVLCGSLPVKLAEGAAEIARVRKTALIGDRRDRFVGGCKQVGGAFQPVLNEIGNGRQMDAPSEKLQGAALADMDGLSDLLQGDLPVIICMDELHHHLQLRGL